jgi:hypothetical protein
LMASVLHIILLTAGSTQLYSTKKVMKVFQFYMYESAKCLMLLCCCNLQEQPRHLQIVHWGLWEWKMWQWHTYWHMSQHMQMAVTYVLVLCFTTLTLLHCWRNCILCIPFLQRKLHLSLYADIISKPPIMDGGCKLYY